MPAPQPHRRPRRGFTLVELLVVLAIVALISAVALPVVLPALNERKIGEAARLVQAVLAGARDTAVRAGAPRGVRFLIDPIFDGKGGNALASNRMIAIEPGPDYAEGFVRTPSTQYYPAPNDAISDPAYIAPVTINGVEVSYLRVSTSGVSGANYNAPTGWSYNVRQGDKIRFYDTGNFYTIAGPIGTAGRADLNNPERFVICTPSTTTYPLATDLTKWVPEYLNLTNGVDDDGDGWIDESCDGIDNDGDGVIDPGFNGIDDNGNGQIDEPAEMLYNKNSSSPLKADPQFNEYETEVFVGTQVALPPKDSDYIITRRPVVSPGARETYLPDGVVLDLTTWNASTVNPGAFTPVQSATSYATFPERSRLPVDPYTGFVDVLIAPNGQVVQPAAGGGGNLARSPIANSPFYHFWLTEREGVNAPLWNKPDGTLMANPNLTSPAGDKRSYLLPMPKGTTGPLYGDPDQINKNRYEPMENNPNNAAQAYKTNPVFLTGQRRLVTLFTRTGQIMTTSIETFDVNDINRPYYDAQAGIKEPQ